jgi:hypothetical protein
MDCASIAVAMLKSELIARTGLSVRLISQEPHRRLFSIGRRKIMLLPLEPPCLADWLEEDATGQKRLPGVG